MRDTNRTDAMTRFFRSRSFRKSKRLRWYAGDFLRTEFPSVGASYVFIVQGVAVYVGSTSNLNTRMRQHRSSDKCVDPESIVVKYRPSKRYGDWAMLELRLIRRLRPSGNIKHCMGGLCRTR